LSAPRRSFSNMHAPAFLTSYFVALIALLYLPLAVLLLFSFNDNTTLVFPLHGMTLRWYD
jgi:spermidine/putrescine transport system permease protein